MTYHHLRNATAVIETETEYILVDPMLGEVGSIEAFTSKRFPPLRNPLVALPDQASGVLDKTTHALITHQHADHLDEAGIDFLKERHIPITCSRLDADALKSKGLHVVQELEYNKAVSFLGGTIQGIPATHGYGKVAELMGNVMGFFIELPNEPSLYLSSDTIYTQEVKDIISKKEPDVSVIPCGSAQLDEHEPILMIMLDILKFVEDCKGQVICNHLEALNHCPTQRKNLKNNITLDTVWIPEDGAKKDYT
jgi:L-ascorbate metabolism protein UlaG (beta-lactamase superfamily)